MPDKIVMVSDSLRVVYYGPQWNVEIQDASGMWNGFAEWDRWDVEVGRAYVGVNVKSLDALIDALQEIKDAQ